MVGGLGSLISGFAGAGGLSPDMWAKGMENFKGGKGLGGNVSEMFKKATGSITPENALAGKGDIMDLVRQQQQALPPQAAGGGGIGGMLDKFKGSLTDDQGLFQGGAKGQMFGRARDKMRPERVTEGARGFAKGFNPQDTDQVMALQKKLNAAGANLEEDGMMGPKTLGALRSLQGGQAQGPPAQAGPAMQQMAADTGQAQNVSNMVGIGLPQQPSGVPAVSPQAGSQDPYGYGTPVNGQTMGVANPMNARVNDPSTWGGSGSNWYGQQFGAGPQY